MNLWKKLGIGAAVVVALFVLVGLLLPSTARVERSVLVQAAPVTVYTVLNGFRQFRRWSPWQDADPDMIVTFDGPVAGPGARMRWSGNAAVGSGSQEILSATPHERIEVRLAFGDWDGDYRSDYTLAPEAGGTRVTWGFSADYGSSLVGRYFGLLSESMLGPDYEKGLARLKDLVEGLPPADFSGIDFVAVEARAEPLVFVSGRTGADRRALGVSLGVAFGKVSGYLTASGVSASGPAVAVFHGQQDGLLYFDAGLPVASAEVEVAGEIRSGYTPAGPAVRMLWRGAPAELPEAHRKLQAYLAAAGLQASGPSWERYPGGAGAVADPSGVVEIYASVK